MGNGMRIVSKLGRRAGRTHRRILLAALAATALSLSQVRMAAADATISIDAASTLPQNGGNVLPTLKNIFQSGNAPGSVSSYADPLADQMLPLMAGIGVKRARLLLVDEYCDIDALGNFGSNSSGSFVANECFPLDWQLDWLIKANLSPHMAVASHMPASFVKFGEAETWGDRRIDPENSNSPKIIDHYKDYAKGLVRHIADKMFAAGAPSAIFEVSNEIDIAADYPTCTGTTCTLPSLGTWGRWLWWMDPSTYDIAGSSQVYTIAQENTARFGFPYNGDVRRLTHNLLPLQKIVSDAIAAVNSQSLYSGKTIEIAGPAMAGWNLIVRPQGTGPSLEEQFIEQTFNASGPFHANLDRFSFHYYGGVEALRTNTTAQLCSTDVTDPFNLFEQMVTAYKTKLNAANMSNVPLFLSEWGATACDTGDVNISHKGAAWVAAFLPVALAQGVTMGSFLTIEDRLVYGGPAATPLLGGASLLHTYGDPSSYTFLPKPPTNVFKMYNLMSGLRNQVTVTPGGSSSHLNAFVTSDQNSTNVMVYNFDPYLVFNNDANMRTDTPENFTISVSNMFKTVGYTGSVKVERYLVDEHHSNLAYFLQHKSETPPPVVSLEQLTDTTATVVNGNLQLASESPLGLGVILYRITPN
jgi:hypothetical protein